METFYVFATWLDVSAISACVGFAACDAWVVDGSDLANESAALWRWLGAAVALLTLSSGVLLVSRTLEMSGAPPSTLASLVPMVLHKTHYGSLWLVRLGALGALWLAWLLGRSGHWRRPATAAAFLALAVISFTRSATGHAGGHGNYSLAVWMDLLHVLSVGLWVGTLFAMSLSVFPRLRAPSRTDPATVTDIFARLSTVSGIALSIIVVTGIYNADQGLGQPTGLWQSRYGLILIAKLVLVAWMVWIGAHNRYVKLPRLRHWAGQGANPRHLLARLPGIARILAEATNPACPHPVRRCERAVGAESVLGLCALLAAAFLHHTMPPADMPHSRPDAALEAPSDAPRRLRAETPGLPDPRQSPTASSS